MSSSLVHDETRDDTRRQETTREEKTRQEKTRDDKRRQEKTRQDMRQDHEQKCIVNQYTPVTEISSEKEHLSKNNIVQNYGT